MFTLLPKAYYTILDNRPHKGEHYIRIKSVYEFLWFKIVGKEREFLGDCTVWFELPNVGNPGTLLEEVLYEIQKEYKLRNKIKSLRKSLSHAPIV